MTTPAKKKTTGGPRTIGMPAGVDPAAWIMSDDGEYGTDGQRMYKRNPFGEEDDRWRLILDAHVRMTRVRRPVPDPDFPDRSEEAGEDTPESGADVEVTTSPKRGAETYVYRNVSTTDLTAMKPLNWAGPDAWRGSKMGPAARGDLAAAVNMLADEYPGGLERAPFYTVTGWQVDTFGRPMFVHGAGAIDANGSRPDVAVQVDSRLARYSLTDPATGAALLEAFECVTDLLACASGRVMAPLIGAMCRSVFGVFKGTGAAEASAVPLVWVSGNTGIGKSGISASALNLQAPAVTYNTLPFKAGSLKNSGASVPGLERILYAARDLVVLFDDLDPSESESNRAQWQSTLLRAAADQKSRLMADGTTNRARAERPCRAMVMGTGEPMDGEASAENRAVNVQMLTGDVDRPALRKATGADDRTRRAAFLAGIVQTIAGDRPRYLARLAAARRSLRPLFADGDVPGPVDRGADSFAELAATWYVVLGMLVESAGMSRRDARDWWGWVSDGLRDAWRGHLSVIGASDRASRAVGYLTEALESGRAHVAAVSSPSGPPVNGPALYGWQRRGMEPDVQWMPQGERIGWRHDDTGDLYLLPSIATAVVRSVADGADDAWTGSTKTLGATFRAGGFMHITESRARKGELAGRGPTLGDGSRPSNVWHLLADALAAAGGGLYRAGDYAGNPEYTAIPGPHIPPHTGGEDGPEAIEDPEPDTPAPAAPVAVRVPAAREAAPATQAGEVEDDDDRQAPAEPAGEARPAVPVARRGRRGTGGIAGQIARIGTLGVDGLHLPDGEVVADVQQLPATLADTIDLMEAHGLRTLYVHADAARAAGLPEAPRLRKGGPDVAIPAAWADLPDASPLSAFPAGGVAPWMRITTGEGYSRNIAFPMYESRFGTKNKKDRGFTACPDARTLHDAVKAFNDAVSRPNSPVAYYRNLNQTVRDLFDKHSRTPHFCEALAEGAVPPANRKCADGYRQMVNTHWDRELTSAEKALGWVHKYDRNTAWLHSYNVRVGVGEPNHAPEGIEYDPKKPGYYRFTDLPENIDARLPELRFHPAPDGGSWLVTPDVELLREVFPEWSPRPVEAYYWEKGAALLQSTGAILRQALAETAALDPAARPGAVYARQVLKAAYKSFVGYLARTRGPDRNRETGELYEGGAPFRPDVDDFVRAQAGANIYRGMLKIGMACDRWPLTLRTDAAVYASDSEDPRAGKPRGMSIGQGGADWDIEGSATMESAIKAVARGRSVADAVKE